MKRSIILNLFLILSLSTINGQLGPNQVKSNSQDDYFEPATQMATRETLNEFLKNLAKESEAVKRDLGQKLREQDGKIRFSALPEKVKENLVFIEKAAGRREVCYLKKSNEFKENDEVAIVKGPNKGKRVFILTKISPEVIDLMKSSNKRFASFMRRIGNPPVCNDIYSTAVIAERTSQNKKIIYIKGNEIQMVEEALTSVQPQ